MGLKIMVLVAVVFALGCAKRTYMSSKNQSGQSKVSDWIECAAQFQTARHCVTLNWEKAPTEGTYGLFTFKVWRPNDLDKSSVPVELPENPRVVLWMPSMGHGSSPVTVEKIEVGTYRASQVFFSMGGDWEIRLQIMNGDKVSDAAIVPYKF